MIIFDYHCYLDYSKPKDVFSYSKGDYTAMRTKLESSEWVVNFLTEARQQNIEEMWASLKKKVRELKVEFVPKTVVTGKPTWTEKGSFPITEQSQLAI